MRELVIKIDMNNAAFGQTRQSEMEEATRIMEAMAKKMMKRGRIADDIENDYNGNCVASVEVIETP